MNSLYKLIIFLSRFYYAKKRMLSISRKYIINRHIYPVLKKMEEVDKIRIYECNFLNIDTAIESDPFKYGLLDRFLRPNDYYINVKDLAIALNMGVFGHSNETFMKEAVIDLSFLLLKKLKERFLLDDNIKYIFSLVGKNVNNINEHGNKEEILTIFSDKKLIFQNYFKFYESSIFGEKIIIFCPSKNSAHIKYGDKETWLNISVCRYDLDKGFFLSGFDYYSENNGWLDMAVRTRNNEYFNPSCNVVGECIWAR